MSSKILTRTLKTLRLSQNMCTLASKSKTPETQAQKLERIADEYLSLTKLERYDYNILFRHKMGLHNLRSAAAPSISSATGNPAVEDKKPAKEKVVFDVKLEKFDASSKIKVIKEVRGFTDLGLKEAKDLVEKVPVVVKKGITKDEADAIAEKLKSVGATVVLE